jgi:hypothetical protein
MSLHRCGRHRYGKRGVRTALRSRLLPQMPTAGLHPRDNLQPATAWIRLALLNALRTILWVVGRRHVLNLHCVDRDGDVRLDHLESPTKLMPSEV